MPSSSPAALPDLTGLSRTLTDLKSTTSGTSREIAGLSKDLSRSLKSNLGSAFDDLILRGKDAGSVLRGLGRDILSSLAQSALSPIKSALTSGISSIGQSAVSGVIGLFSGGSAPSVSPNALGNAFVAGRERLIPQITPFARGGVVSSPTFFPMASGSAQGRIGLMGEAGPEAILPLTRGADGRLGVSSAGGSGAGGRGGTMPPVQVTIQTRDAESFARSSSQTAALLAKALSRARRNS
ncbi:MAG: phage tail tape measure protein [Neomegalonema sp.]|nr:phage tail tape measure protein [Neomegalonema sp.]